MKLQRIFVTLMLKLFISQSLMGGIVVHGNDPNPPYAFKTTISQALLDPQTGTFYVGLDNGSDRFTISRALRPTFNTVATFEPVLPLVEGSDTLEFDTINLLALSPQISPHLPVLGVVIAPKDESDPVIINALFSNGTSKQATQDLNDASGASKAHAINQLAANSSLFFAAVNAHGGNWGDLNSGIALVGIDVDNNTLSLATRNATTGLAGNQAVPFDITCSFLTGGTTDVAFISSSASLYWDETLQRLFVGSRITSGPDSSDIAKSVVVGRVVNGALILTDIVSNDALTTDVDNIIVAQGAEISLGPTHIRVMHTSTGPDYLIVDGNSSDASNCVFALPLVHDTSNIMNVNNGTLADKNNFDTSSGKFTTPAEANNELVADDLSTDSQGIVGAGKLPVESSQTISDMQVIGDAVYVSLDITPDTTNDTGIWYSQAEFDNEGKIQRWTPWASKRIIPVNAFQDITLPGGVIHNGAIYAFAVDAVSGNVWYVEGTTRKTVGITSWTTGINPTDLVSSVRTALTNSSYSVLDLNQSTRGFLDATPYRYALFGGVNRVVFARTSQASDDATLESPQTSYTNFASAENFLISNLPPNAGCCSVLEYSRADDTAPNLNYFFAGTGNGLFVFINTEDEGFDASQLKALNDPPFSNREWKKMETIRGSVVDIKTSGAGQNLYVIASESTATQPLKSTLYRIPFAATTAAMFHENNIIRIAETQTGVFAKALQFYGIQIIATNDPLADPENKEQLVLATSHGLYISHANQSGAAGIPDAINQDTAQWQALSDGSSTTQNTMFYGIGGMDTPIRNTIWPYSIQDFAKFQTYDRGSIHQLSGTGNNDGSEALFNNFFIPSAFNAQSQSSIFKTLSRIIYFFSDGARRFFIFNRTIDPAEQTKLALLPYDIVQWKVAQPTIINDPTISAEERFYWVRSIGATGIIMAGTEQGVIGLQ